MKELLKAIFTQLKTVPAIKWIDEDFGQIDAYEERPAVQFPCALVSISQTHDALGSDEYDVTSSITVRVAHSRFADRPAQAPEAAFALTLSKLDDVEAVKTALEGFEVPGHSGRFYLRGVATERRTDGLSVKSITFSEVH